MDLIKCSMCGHLVCDNCSGVKVSKLRPVMNQCSTLYFACQTCDTMIRDTNDINVYDVLKGKVEALTEELVNYEEESKKLTQQVKTLDGQQASLKTLLEEREESLQESETKLASLEQGGGSIPQGGNIEALINKRFDKIDKNIDANLRLRATGGPDNCCDKKSFHATFPNQTNLGSKAIFVFDFI